MTRPETLLWRYLKAEHLAGLSFRRQTPIGNYIVDFACHAARLIVEVDGKTHDFVSRLRRDYRRDKWLSSRGYFVLRFTDQDVLQNLEGVLSVIGERARARSLNAPPSPPLPRKGGGSRLSKTFGNSARKTGDRSTKNWRSNLDEAGRTS